MKLVLAIRYSINFQTKMYISRITVVEVVERMRITHAGLSVTW